MRRCLGVLIHRFVSKYGRYCGALLTFYLFLLIVDRFGAQMQRTRYVNTLCADCDACYVALRKNSTPTSASHNIHKHHSPVSRVVSHADSSQSAARSVSKPQCPESHGAIPVSNSVCISPNFGFGELSRLHPELQPGGQWQPKDCVPKERVAIVIPYRNREYHLLTLLHRLHAMLQRQSVCYGIYVVEQLDESIFNRGMMKNIGFSEALKDHSYDCVYFHDVDLIPEDDRNLYDCPSVPRHHCVLLNDWDYSECYSRLVGGVMALGSHDFERINGFSNMYFGWGAEDDDMFLRMNHLGMQVVNYPVKQFARYTMLTHKKEQKSKNRLGLMMTSATRMVKDGLNSLKYRLVSKQRKPLYTLLQVRINKTEVWGGSHPPVSYQPSWFEHSFWWEWHFTDFTFFVNKMLLKC